MCQRIDLGDGNYAIVCGGRRVSKPKLHLPATAEQLKAAGWRPLYSRACKLCHNPLEFWRTENGKPMPLESVIIEGTWLLASHWATCPFADKFRKPGKPAVEKSGDLFPMEAV